jgi:hypothetical protein
MNKKGLPQHERGKQVPCDDLFFISCFLPSQRAAPLDATIFRVYLTMTGLSQSQKNHRPAFFDRTVKCHSRFRLENNRQDILQHITIRFSDGTGVSGSRISSGDLS